MQPAGLGALAGLPTVAGAWIGGLTYQPGLAVFFLALGAEAIFQVVWALAGLIQRDSELGWSTAFNAAGLVAGGVVMYSTALPVVA